MAGESISLEVTTNCNCSCRHCFARAGRSSFSHLPAGLAADAVREAFGLGYRHLHLTGGEPLLWKELFPTLDMAVSLGYKSIFLNTNGTLLDRDTAHRLAGYGLLSLSISLQGPERHHDSFRGKSRYRQAAGGIENAIAAGISTVIFTTVAKSMMPLIEAFIDEIFATWPDIEGLSLIQLIRVPDDTFDLSRELLDPHDFLTLVQLVCLMNLCGRRTDILNNPLAASAASLLGRYRLPAAAPLQRNGHMTLLADGGITLCHSSRKIFGRYRSGQFRKILDMPEYTNQLSPDIDTCPSCKHHRLCRQNGQLRPSEWFRDIHPSIPFCRRVLDAAKLFRP